MTKSYQKRVYYQDIKDPQDYLNTYNTLRMSPTNVLQAKAVLEFLPKMDWPNISLLDLGCGGGFFTKKLMDMGVRSAYCCDIENACIEACKITNPQANVVKSDVTNLVFNDEQFDLVLAIDIIEHVQDENKMLDEILRVLKPGGYIIICTQNKISLENILGKILCLVSGKEWKGWDPTHVRFYSAFSLRRALVQKGLTGMQFNGTLYLPFHFLGRVFGKPLEMLGFSKTANIMERAVSYPFYLINLLFEASSLFFPINVLGWGIIARGRKSK